MRGAALCAASLIALAACADRPGRKETPDARHAAGKDTCTGTFPSYWQDPDPRFAEMWRDETVSNAPPEGWSGPVFRLSDAFPAEPVDEADDQPWRASRFDALFDRATPQAARAELARDYAWAVMRYLQEGNVGRGDVSRDWDVCRNPVRGWYHMPFQTYDTLSGREFAHGLTREAPVVFNVRNPDHPEASLSVATNISDPTFCKCTLPDKKSCSMAEQSRQCARSTEAWGPVRLVQFDVAIRDHRAPGTEWVFGTFVADGQRKATEPNPWNRISPLGLMWGNDQPPADGLARSHPVDPRANGFAEEVVFWDTVDMLNAVGGDVPSQRPGHLGCNQRLNGPADNANSSCMSCHMTASVVDLDGHTPPIIAQFGQGITFECVSPDAGDPRHGTDAAGARAEVEDGVTFSQMDGLYFANTAAGRPMAFTVETPAGPRNVLGNQPRYGDGRSQWIALDFSLQLSISLVQWHAWQKHRAAGAGAPRVLSATLPGR